VSRRRNPRQRRRSKSTAPQVPPRAPRRPALEERPKAPWHPFPLVELSVLIGIVCIVVGFLSRDGTGGRTVLVLGFALGALGGLDTTLREHLSGYRSHTLVLAAFPAVTLAVLAAVARAPRIVIFPLLVLVFAVAALALRRAWNRTADRSPA
jgi:hypothetical protein